MVICTFGLFGSMRSPPLWTDCGRRWQSARAPTISFCGGAQGRVIALLKDFSTPPSSALLPAPMNIETGDASEATKVYTEKDRAFRL